MDELKKITEEHDSAYHLVPFKSFQHGKKLRSNRYHSFHVLCFLNTHKQAGWLVCNFALTGGCKLSQALLTFNTSTGGTGRLERHVLQQTKKTTIQTLPKALPQMSKAVIARCAALAVALDLRPISFTDNQKGLRFFVNSIFRAGQATAVSDNIDTKTIVPCRKTVSTALTKLAEDNRGEYKALLPEMIKIGGAVTTDGVTLKVQDKQFYDLTIHYIECLTTSAFDATPKFVMRCRTLLLREKKGEGSGEQLRSLLGNGLMEYYGCDIDSLTQGFTMVTDNASVMARVAGASISARIAPLSMKWVGCIFHQINTALKSCISALATDEDLQKIFDDLQSVKKIVRIFKQSNWNALLPEGYKLIQEVETRFGTTFQVVQRFLKSSSHVEEIISSKDSVPAKNALESLGKIWSESGRITFPALEAIVDAFRDGIELQTTFQASNHPTFHLALPKLKMCTDKLRSVVDGGSVSRGPEVGFIPAPTLSRGLSQTLLEWLDAKVRIHPLVMAGCFMNPLFREFQFLEDPSKRQKYREGGEAMVRSIIACQKSDSIASSDRNPRGQLNHAIDHLETDDQPNVVGRKRTYSLLEYADSHFESTTIVDEVSRYNSMDIGQLGIDRVTFMGDPFAAIRFWHNHRSSYPDLYKVAQRLYAIPVSSCASERVFSAVNRIITRDRAILSSKALEEIVVVRSLLSD